MSKIFLQTFATMLLSLFGLQAQQVVDLTTGVDGYGGLIPIGSMDPKWSIDRPDSPGLQFQPVGCGNGGLNNGAIHYFPFNLCSFGRWLSPVLDPNGFTLPNNSPVGTYVYQMTFGTSSCIVTSDTLFLSCIGADNSVSSISINGHVIPIGTPNCTWIGDTIPLLPSDIIVGGSNIVRVEVFNQSIYTGLKIMGHLDIQYGFGCPLPVVYSSAPTVESLHHDNVLRWSTSQEVNSKWFIIERSVNLDAGFEAIGHVRAIGHSDVITDYTFVDTTVSQNPNYYRIRQVDENGIAVLSEVVMADNRAMPDEFMVWPNPMKGQLHYRLQPEVNLQIALYDMTGNLAGEYSLTSPVDGNEGVIDLDEIVAGNYVLIAHDQIGRILKRMILRKE